MRKDFGAKEWLYPMPVLIIGTYDKNGNADAMNAAWGGISDTKQIMICLSPEHKTVANILEQKAFTVSLATADGLAKWDYVGVVSANDVPEKLSKAGITTSKAANVNAPFIDELPFTLECKLISYDEKSCHLFGEIVNISVDEKILGADGKVDLSKLKPITFDAVHNKYVQLGEVVGSAFSDGLKLK